MRHSIGYYWKGLLREIKYGIFIFLKKILDFLLNFEVTHFFIGKNLISAISVLHFFQSMYINRLFVSGKVQEFCLIPFKALDKSAEIIIEWVPPEIPTVTPQFYNKAILSEEHRTLKLPSVFIGRVSNVDFISGTDLLVKGKNIYSDLLHHADGYRHSIKMLQALSFGFYGKTLALNLNTLPCASIKKGIHFSCDYAFNYFHWLFECLPRCYFLEDINLSLDYPFLIDQGLPPQHLEALKLIVGEKRPIIFLEKLKRYQVEDLVYPSFLSVCNDHKEYTQSQPEDFLISPYAIEFVRTKMLAHLSQQIKPNKKIYICRKENGRRSLLNKQKLIPQVVKLGFELVFPEKLSLMEQISLFNQAEVILCETGAGMSNMIFCQPKTQIIVLVAETKNANYHFFSQIAEHCQLTLTYFMGVAENSFNIHSNFVIDISALMKIMRRVDKSGGLI